MPRAATYYELYGIHDPERVHATISDQIHSYSEAPILKRIEGLIRDQGTPRPSPSETKQTKPEKEQVA